MDKCKKGDHDFRVINRRNYDLEEYVIRWCENCGCIVGDIEFDGRLKPGGLFKIKGSNLFKQLIQQG